MLGRTLSYAAALGGAVVASQLPEFAQQYAQRLGGAVDELTRVVARFDADSVAVGEKREGALARLAASQDELARRQAGAMRANIERLDALEAQEARLATAGPLGRIGVLVSEADPAVSAATWRSFEPGIPTTAAGAVAGGAGAIAGGGIMAMLARLLRRRPRRVATR
jgi:hypothetical protein